MNKKTFSIVICFLLITTAVSIVESLKNNTINPIVPSTPLTSTAANWTETEKLITTDCARNDNFSYSVSLSGDTSLIGVPDDDNKTTNSDSAYVFTKEDENQPPVFGTPTPINGSTNNPLSLTWSIPINDSEGDVFSWTIQCSNEQSASGNGSIPYYPASLPPSGYFSEKWHKTQTYLGMTGDAEAVTQDVDGNGIQEIFFNGIVFNSDYDGLGNTPTENKLVCLNGSTGNIIWSFTYPNGYPTSAGIPHYPVMVYDFNKDGKYEVFPSSGAYYWYLLDAETGIVLVNKTEPNIGTQKAGWHNQGFIDKGSVVYIYVSSLNSNSSNGLYQLWGNNLTIKHYAHHVYSCHGGVSIADLNNDGAYEIIVTDRSGTGRGMDCFDENLTKLWSRPDIFCSTQTAIICDPDNDGRLEVVVGYQSQSAGRIYILNGTTGASKYEQAVGVTTHTQPVVADIDNDSHLEFISGMSYGTPKVFDLVTKTVEYICNISYYNPDVEDIIPDTGGFYPELIVTTTNSKVVKYNRTSHSYYTAYVIPVSAVTWSMASDVDYDGYNEFIFQKCRAWPDISTTGLYCYETKAPVQTPQPITYVEYGGMRRMNNFNYLTPPGYVPASYTENNGTKSISLSSLAYSTTYTVWVNATDPTGSGLYTRKWYTFTTKASQPPEFGTPTPANGSTNNPLSLTWSIPINDPEGDLFSWTIQCSNGQVSSGTGATNGTKSLTLSGLAYSTTYKVWVNATDPTGSGLYTKKWYTFTTQAALVNNPPVFGTPSPANGSTGNLLSLSWSIPISDPEGNSINWVIQCSNGQSSYANGTSNGTKSLLLSGLAYFTTYKVWVNATDPTGSGLYTRKWYTFTIKANQPPNPPTITGTAKGKINVPTDYNFTTIDSEGDEVYYFIDWGDTTNSSWIGPYSSGDLITESHTWSKKGIYTIKAKAKDIFGNESDWGTLSVTMPKSTAYIPSLFLEILERLMERFPHAFPNLRQLLGY